jgi:hypothetical protein
MSSVAIGPSEFNNAYLLDNIRLEGVREPLRRPSRRRTQQALHLSCPQDRQDGVDQRRLADTRSASDDHNPIFENGLQCLTLAGSQRLAPDTR